MEKLNAAQIEAVLDHLVPAIAEPEDYEFFRGTLGIALENMTASQVSAFVCGMLNPVAK